eukprot:CAMPEP_0113947066 /NCGR_PEP_ID=MMETSP1339-20121228/61959_1 /TAXON_ID=94617 /ORGANISM="Fibrocapsa japonica" /LENGTH=116 /DNA_ID=CAMNT_0000953447 /DNA_START=66 /DNA_END=413 /DNA_ORIENTATION=- /assembly_acc=CAM_ASM_000762
MPPPPPSHNASNEIIETHCAQCGKEVLIMPNGQRCTENDIHNYINQKTLPVMQELERLKNENRMLRDSATTFQQQCAELTQRNQQIAQLQEQLKAAEYKNYALTVHLSEFNKPSLC